MSPLKCSMVAGFYKISLLAIFDTFTQVRLANSFTYVPVRLEENINVYTVQGRGQDGTLWYPCLYFSGRGYFAFNRNS